MSHVSRREFLEGTLLSLGGMVLPVSAFGESSQKILSFGVVSDIHVDRTPRIAPELESVFRYFDANRVDAVMIPGDLADSGLIREMERFAEIWYKVFPNDCGGDGRHVEKLFVTGNHCLDGWHGRWNGWSEERLRKERFHYADNPKKVWERLFHEEYKLIWEKQVKGITFIGAQWRCLEPPVELPPVEEFFKAKRGKLDPNLPFFFTQHAHPQGTCHGAYACAGSGGPEARRALNAFPNAVAITGHSHCTITDSRTVWQGEFTSIGAGCLHEGGASLSYANVSYSWFRPSKDRLMKCTDWVDRGGCAMIVDVYADHLVIHRHSVRLNAPLGEDWAVPLPAAYGRGFDFKVREKLTVPPQFPAALGVVAKVTLHPAGHPAAKPEFAKDPCYSVSFRPATTRNGRVFDYKIEVFANGRVVKSEKIVANGFASPLPCPLGEELYLVRTADLPSGVELEFVITPAECFGKTGHPLKVRIKG